MKLLLICPAPAGSGLGNRVSAERWARLLRGGRHRVQIAGGYTGQPADGLIALHARRSHRAIVSFHRARPAAPIVLVLTGTDLYRDLETHATARVSLELARRIVVLHPLGAERLPLRLRARTRAIVQGAVARPSAGGVRRAGRGFDVLVAGHLRAVKDPFHAAMAVRGLPAASRIRVLHAGAALTPAMAERAEAETARNPRYRWLGNVTRARVAGLMVRSRAMVLSSRMEGGANVIGEAAVAGLPILAARIHSSLGLLGADYAGYFPPGDTRALRRLLLRSETDPRFLAGLTRQIAARAGLFDPARERAAWLQLIGEIESTPASAGIL